LHYDFRLEAAGVLLSWAVPKGPTLDPDVKRLAMRVEDHPLDYFDFEGVIAQGEYGAGDVIVWDWGTWRMADDTDPIAARADGALHFDLDGEKLSGHFALVRRGPASDKEQWLLVHKHDDSAVAGWKPEDYPRSVKSGLTNDDVKTSADPTGSSRWEPPTADELDAFDALRNAGEWSLGGLSLRLTNLDKVLFPRRGKMRSLTKRDLIRHYATTAMAILPYVADRPINLHRYPGGIDRPGFWHKASPEHAPPWLRRWHNDDADPGETQTYSVLDSPAALVWAANFGAIELHPWTSTVVDTHAPTWAFIDIDPGDKSTFDDVINVGAAASHRPRTPRRQRLSQSHRETRHTDLDTRRTRLQL
jgi:bifunctional non-homologous end joining protein LigD